MHLTMGKLFRMVATGIKNYWTDKPLCLSFEVLNSCNLNCHHCNWGGQVQEDLLTPEQIRDICLEYNPLVVQISGGEPLLRDDIEDICRAVKQNNGIPYLQLVSNASLMTEEKYLALKNAGVDQFSISLDFPDKRHDYFRRRPGLFEHLNTLLPRLASLGYDDIILNTAITHENFRDLKKIVDVAERWGVFLSFSAYTIIRTANRDLTINKDELILFREIIDELIDLKRANRNITTAVHTLKKTYEFFRDGKISGCKAGKYFLVVTPTGLLLPCAMHRGQLFETQDEMIRIFSDNNKCGSCFVSIRAYTEKNLFNLTKSSLSSFIAIRRSSLGARKRFPTTEPERNRVGYLKPKEYPGEKRELVPLTNKQIQALQEAAPEGMVLIPPGEFIMGDGFREPLHKVYLDAFYLDIYPVTNEQFNRFLEQSGYQTEDSLKRTRGKRKGIEKRPVIRVTWHDAVAYAEWAGKRLPTEAEWEKAARGDLYQKKYAWGEDPPDETKSNYAKKPGHPTEVGLYPPNGYGLYDMCGNVWEWCADWFDINYYKQSPYCNPQGPDNGHERVLRGGSWFLTPNNMQCSFRSSNYPNYQDITIGFRCAKSIDLSVLP